MTTAAGTDSLSRVISTQGVPIHLYTHEIEEEVLEQLLTLAESLIPVDYVSAMPDVHLEKGVTDETIFASDKYTCPNDVSVDI